MRPAERAALPMVSCAAVVMTSSLGSSQSSDHMWTAPPQLALGLAARPLGVRLEPADALEQRGGGRAGRGPCQSSRRESAPAWHIRYGGSRVTRAERRPAGSTARGQIAQRPDGALHDLVPLSPQAVELFVHHPVFP